MSLLAITGFNHLPKNTTNWITYRPDFVNQWAASTRGDQVNNDGYLYTTGTVDDLLQFDISKVFNSASTAFWVSWKMKILTAGTTAQNLILFDTAQAPGSNPTRPFQMISTASILTGYAVGQEYQIDVKFDKVTKTYTVMVNGVQAATGAIASNVQPHLANGNFFLCIFLRNAGNAGQMGVKSMTVYDNVDSGDGVIDYLGLIEVEKVDITSAESVTPGDWAPTVVTDTLLQAISKPIDTAPASAGVTTVKTTALDIGISLTVPNTKRIRGIGFLTSSKTTSGGTPLKQSLGGVPGVDIAQKVTLTHGQRSKAFTMDSNGLIWTEETANAAKLSITTG